MICNCGFIGGSSNLVVIVVGGATLFTFTGTGASTVGGTRLPALPSPNPKTLGLAPESDNGPAGNIDFGSPSGQVNDGAEDGPGDNALKSGVELPLTCGGVPIVGLFLLLGSLGSGAVLGLSLLPALKSISSTDSAMRCLFGLLPFLGCWRACSVFRKS